MKLVEYNPGARTRRIALSVFLCALALRLVLAGLSLFAGLIVSGTVTLELLNYVVLLSAFFLVRKKKVLVFALLALGLVLNTALFLLHNDGTEYRFSSPEQTNALVIREKSALVSSGLSEVYRRRFGILLEPMDVQLGTGDKYHPFPSGQYRVSWPDESTALLTYYDGTQYRDIELRF